MSALSAGSAAVALAEGEIFEDDNDEELNKTKPQKQRVVGMDGTLDHVSREGERYFIFRVLTDPRKMDRRSNH